VAEASDEALSVLWEGVCVEVGIAVANAATLFDPEVVVLGGGMSQDERLVAEVSAALNRLVMFRPRLELAVFGRDAALVGASLAAWELSSQISGGPRSHDDPRTGQP
jgi:glucokinase